MTPDDFPRFYRAVHGYDPFPWQKRLAREVADRGWPAVLALPTAAGKTSAIDVAVFTLALQGGKPLAERTCPLRIFFVIDRRLVVDQAAEHARRLKKALENPGAEPTVREVTQRLTAFGGPGPLHVAALRGGMYRDDSWARAPNQPTVCLSTVDQIGSRLLFRGYGLTEFRRPVHAGLTGNDALYLIDEAHLSQPFLETLQAVCKYRSWAEVPIPGPFAVVEMSATPITSGDRFGLSDGDRDNEVLRSRLSAPKPATLEEPASFESQAAKRAREALQRDKVRVVGVVVNRVASARRIFEELRGDRKAEAILLTGRIRPWDREQLLGEWLGRMRAGRIRRPEDKPVFVVATQTVEVGADFDFDFLITEAAPLPALRQRFGRLDRLGRFGDAAGVVMRRKAKDADPIYGEDLAMAWEWLNGLPKGGADGTTIDFGINALDECISNAQVPPPLPAERHGPVMFPSHVDTWAQTSPTPQPDPDVAPFLHGRDALEAADVQIIWRADLTWDATKAPREIEREWIEAVAMARPVVLESLPLSLGAARAWLGNGAGVEVADVEGTSAESAVSKTATPRLALRWQGPEESALVGPGQIAPGDTLIFPASYGGVDQFGWDPTLRQPVRDVGDDCFNLLADSAPRDGRRQPIRLRLHPGLFRQFLAGSEDEGQLAEMTQTLNRVHQQIVEGSEVDYQGHLRKLLAVYKELVSGEPLMTAAIDRFLELEQVTPATYPGGLVLTRRVGPGFSGAPLPLPSEVSDGGEAAEDDTSSLTRSVSLKEHTEGVMAWVNRFSQGLDRRLAKALERAAAVHDYGKADPRFQAMLYGGDPVAAAGGELLAKSGMNKEDRGLFRQAWKASGLPRRFRHEFVSVALVRRHRDQVLADLSEDDRDFVEYLVGTHHGRGRPFPPVVEETSPEPVSLDWDGQCLSASSDHGLWRLDSGWTDLYWQMVRRHGYWGLAYLEAVLVLADQGRSREEEQNA
jgi:CRISPR-associated endonuclease/helicase Cas3